MITHIVMWTLHQPEDAPRMKSLLESCCNLSDGMVKFEVGIRTAGLEANADVVLSAVFRDQTALDAYQNHPAHLAIKPQVAQMRKSRTVLDYLSDA